MTTTDIGAARRIHELMEPWIDTTPDAPALRDAHDAFTYRQLHDAATATADLLTACGVRAGDRVVIVGENCTAIGVLVLALSRLDAWSCAVNGRLSEREVDQIVAHSGARRVLYTCYASADAQTHATRHGAVGFSWPGKGDVRIGPLAAEAAAEACSISPAQQVAVLIYTSGTSGAPKGVMLTHANLMFTAMNARDQRKLRPADLVYGVLPMAHIVGLSSQLLGSLAGGASLLLDPRFCADSLVKAFEELGVTVFTGVPAMYAKLLTALRARNEPLRAPKLRFIGVAGSPLTPSLKAEIEQALGIPLSNGYGMTEMGPTICQTPTGAPRTDCAVGPPIAGVQTRIVDDSGSDVAAGQVGELWVRGPNLMKGYYRNEQQTRAAISAKGWLNTGDMARRGDDGALHIVGRTKELIIRSGFNVYPVEVEQVLNSCPGVVQSAVVGRSVDHNEEVIAFVEPVPGTLLDESSLKEYVRERLSPYKVPSEIRFLAQLPSAPSGKVLKSALADMARHKLDDPAS